MSQKILIISGSIREQSYTCALSDYVAGVLNKKDLEVAH